jgi:hypothetical protein
MSSDISLCDGSEQGIADGVDENIRIGMSHQPEEIGDSYSTQDQRPP